MFKLAFSVLLVAAIYQVAVLSVPVDSDTDTTGSHGSHSSSSSPSFLERLEIVGKAAVDIFKGARDLAKDLTKIVETEVKEEVNKLAKRLLLRIEIMMIASGGVNKTGVWRECSAADLKEYQVVAKSVEAMVERLDKMEVADKIIKKTIRYTVNQTTDHNSESEAEKILFPALDKWFQGDQVLQVMYKQQRDKYEKEIPLPTETVPRKMSTDKSGMTDKTFVKMLLNFVFIQYINHSLTTPQDHYILARSLVELSKDASKCDEVQSIYEATLQQLAETVDVHSKDSNMARNLIEGLFAQLKENFEKNSTIYPALQTTEKEVSQRNDWGKSIWSLPV